jgi:hypothetical protein
MRDLFNVSPRWLTTIGLTLAFVVAACGGAATPTAGAKGGATPSGAAASAPSSAGGGNTGAQSSPGAVDVQGSLVSSGLYAATWTWQPGNAADVGIGGVTLTSDKGTFGSITVLNDGTITFSTGAPEISAGQPYRGKGAQVHIKDVQGVQLPCSYTLDNDVTGSNGAVLHLKGTLTITGTPFNC